MQSPVKKIYITQVFGVNKANYVKFGLNGHNGIDFRAFLPNEERCSVGGKSEVFAPHDGVVRECAFDAGGYGNYVKIESIAEGSTLAHFSTLPTLKVGQTVKQGQFVGYQGTTGNSTGIHLHWGYYKIPRNRNNGFNGYINQQGTYQAFSEGESMATVELDANKFEELVSKSTKYDEFVRAGFSDAQQALIRIAELERSLSQKPKEIIKEVVITKEVPVEIIKEVIVTQPNDTLGALQLITLSVQAIVAGRW